MKKNLKKVISAVVAFALTASSAAFAAAPSFSDVADTASYAEAVNTLTALGVISGYEDGTFKPDDKITRAEVSTMIVAAINRTADAQGQMGNTKFADMNNEAKKWASGYVNVAVSENIIAGFEDGTFKPDEQVTYVQVVKMLVCAAGYGQYAEYLGGWPNGYLSVASDKGVTAGVSAGQDEAVTRGQVAQLIYNTLDIPMVASNGFSISESTGAVVPSLKVMDGKGSGDDKRDYQSLLTEKHHAYKVEGSVVATNRTDSTGCDADEVKFEIQYTENYDDSDIVVKKNTDASNYKTVTIKVGDTDAAEYLLTYATAIVKIDGNDDATFVSFIPSGKNKVEEFDASLIDDEDYSLTENSTTASNYLKFYATSSASKSSKYSLEKDLDKVGLYVNGVKVDTTKANIEDYVIKNTTGKVRLMDTYNANDKTNGYYDAIFVTYYATARVDDVNASKSKITFKDQTTNAKGSLTLDTDANDELVYEILLNGEKIELSALQEDDILSIAYDVTAAKNGKSSFDNSNFYEIYVSRDKAEGQYTTRDTDDETVTIGGTAYEFVKKYDDEIKGMNIGDQYTVYLDAFGRIFANEQLAASTKYAILESYTKSSGDYYAQLYTADGASKKVMLDSSKVKNADAFKKGETNIDNAILDFVYENGSGNSSDKKAVEGRVVEYKISASTGNLIEMKPVAGTSALEKTYKNGNTSVGSVKMNSATKVIDATDYEEKRSDGGKVTTSDLKLTSLSVFIDGSDYSVVGFGDRTKNSDNAFPFVIVIKGESTYTSATKLAVLTKPVEEAVDDTYNVKALFEKDEQTFTTTDDVDVYIGATKKSVTDLSKGDVVALVFDANGKVKEITAVMQASALGTDTSYEKVRENAEKGTALKNILLPRDTVNEWTKEWSDDYTGYPKADEVTQLVYGPIVDKASNSFTLGTYNADKKTNKYATFDGVTGSITDTDAKKNGLGSSLLISTNADTRVYVYDFGAGKDDRFSCGGTGDILNSTISKSLLEDDATYGADSIINWSTVTDDVVNYAFAKVVEGIATDVYVIIAD